VEEEVECQEWAVCLEELVEQVVQEAEPQEVISQIYSPRTQLRHPHQRRQ
jgi:hypothetical protein